MIKEAVLIHGWDPSKYNRVFDSPPPEDVGWLHRSRLIDLLSSHFVLRYYNLPGFCGVAEPSVKFFDVEDFSQEFLDWMKVNGEKVGLIVGYSFGGTVALSYKEKSGSRIPTVLISPAINRFHSVKSELASAIRRFVPEKWAAFLKHLYQWLASGYYREGTPFLRSSYDVVVRRDLLKLLSRVDKESLMLIYGENDMDTPWKLVEDEVTKLGLSYYLIKDGGHNIGQTHPQEIVSAILGFAQRLDR